MKKYLKLIVMVVACFILIRACFSCGEEKKETVHEEKIPVIDNGKTNVLMYPSDSIYMAEINLEGSGWKRMGGYFR